MGRGKGREKGGERRGRKGRENMFHGSWGYGCPWAWL